MKKFLFLSVICSLLFACSAKPSDYQAEITDAVKFYTATWETAIEASNANEEVDSIWAVRDRLIDIYPVTEESKEVFKVLLENEKSEWGKRILKKYNIAEPVLSEYVRTVKTNEWVFQEQNTGVHFFFRLIEVDKKTSFEIEPNEKEAQHYLVRKSYSEDLLQLCEIMGYDVDSLIDASIAEVEMENCITKRIKSKYDNQLSDNEIMSKAFYSVFHEAQLNDDSEMGWPDWNYWACTNGDYATFSSVQVEVISDGKAMAHVQLFYHEAEEYHNVDMPMIFENDNWYVDDIIDTNGGYSLKEAARSLISK